jgi:hypothetical protein
MKPIADILTILQADLSAALPALITAAGLTDFEVYKIGGSRNAKQIGLFIYHDDLNITYDQETVTIIVQLQLYNIDGLPSAQYTDIVSEYLRDYEPGRIECDLLQGMSIDTWPLDQNSTTFVYLTCTWTSELDSCDHP